MPVPLHSSKIRNMHAGSYAALTARPELAAHVGNIAAIGVDIDYATGVLLALILGTRCVRAQRVPRWSVPRPMRGYQSRWPTN